MTTSDAPAPRSALAAEEEAAKEEQAWPATLERVSDVLAHLRPDPGPEADHRRIAGALTALRARCTALGAPPPRR